MTALKGASTTSSDQAVGLVHRLGYVRYATPLVALKIREGQQHPGRVLIRS